MTSTPAYRDPDRQRVVAVTGAASGVGHATATLFREQGAIVYSLDINDTVPEGTTYVECNVGSKAAIDAAFEVIGAHGYLDVLANVAGIVQFGRFENVSEAEFDRVQAVDLKGPYFTMQAALPLLQAVRGCIVNVSSVAGRVPQPFSSAYSAAKGGLTQLTQSLAMELSPHRVRVNAICPGTIDTPMVAHVAENYPPDLEQRLAERLLMLIPGKAIAPSEIAATIGFLASPEARMISGAVIAHDGVMS